MSFLHKAFSEIKSSAEQFLQTASPNESFYGEAVCFVSMGLGRIQKPHFFQGNRIERQKDDFSTELISVSPYKVEHPEALHIPIPKEVFQAVSDTVFTYLPESRIEKVQLNGLYNHKTHFLANQNIGIVQSTQANYTFLISAIIQNQYWEKSASFTSLDDFYTFPPEKLAMELCQEYELQQGRLQEVSGEMPVIFWNGWNGVWLHEVLGHLLEGDVVLHGKSSLAPNGTQHFGQKIAPSFLTLKDDPRIHGFRACYEYDDEGTKAESTMLIQNGILQNFLTDQFTAHHLGTQSSGNGRRADFRYPVMPRMSNLYLENGESSPHDFIADVKKGILIKSCRSAEINTETQTCWVMVTEGNLIEQGRITNPIRPVKVRLKMPEDLWRIVSIGNDLAFETSRGQCVKYDAVQNRQVVRIGIGQPSVYFDSLQVEGGNLTDFGFSNKV